MADRDETVFAATVPTVDRQTGLPTLICFCSDVNNQLRQATPLTLIVCFLHNLPPEPDDDATPSVILDVARLLGDTVRGVSDAKLYRNTYDSFVIVLPETERPHGLALAEQARTGIERIGSDLTASLAVGSAPHDANEAGMLLAICEAQLFGADCEPNCVLSAAPIESLPPATARLAHALHARLRTVVELSEQLRVTEEQAMHDLTTGLPNARSLQQTLPRMLDRHAHSNKPLALLLVDGDNLREYNTRYGYAAGNEWIRSVARTLAANLRPGDYVARWMMGDEFVVLLPNTASETARRIADRLRSAIDVAGKTNDFPGTVSIGAVVVHGTMHAEAVLDQARDALLAAKEHGKNQLYLIEMAHEEHLVRDNQQ